MKYILHIVVETDIHEETVDECFGSAVDGLNDNLWEMGDAQPYTISVNDEVNVIRFPSA